jgi:hypothetical protein
VAEQFFFGIQLLVDLDARNQSQRLIIHERTSGLTRL